MTHKTWWETEASAMRPFPNEDIEEFSKRITAIAWSNAEYVEREACAQVCEAHEDDGGEWDIQQQCANKIRARGKA